MELSRDTRRILWVVFAGYLLLLGMALFTDSELARTGVDIAFILIVLGFAGFAYREFSHEPLGILTSVALAAAAIGSAIDVVFAIPALRATADVLLIFGIVLYLYLRWR